jgi:hypothetical protein
MIDTSVGKSGRVALRQVCKHQSIDFTKWLQDNIDVLNTTLGLADLGACNEPA